MAAVRNRSFPDTREATASDRRDVRGAGRVERDLGRERAASADDAPLGFADLDLRNRHRLSGQRDLFELLALTFAFMAFVAVVGVASLAMVILMTLLAVVVFVPSLAMVILVTLLAVLVAPL